MNTEDIEIIEPAHVALQRSRAQWEAEQMEALRERRARRQPITDAEVSAWQERRAESLLLDINARAAAVRARWPAPKNVPQRYERQARPPESEPRRGWDEPSPNAATIARRREQAERAREEREEQLDRALVLLDDGATLADLAADLEMSEYMVRRLLRDAGVQPPPVLPPRSQAPTPAPAPAPSVARPAPAPAMPPAPAGPPGQEAQAPPPAPSPAPAPRKPRTQEVTKRLTGAERMAAKGVQRRARVVELTAAGKTERQVAKIMGVSLDCVRGHLRAAGLAPEPAQVEKGSDADWPALYRDGKTIQQIADLSGWSTTHVRLKLLEAGVEMRITGHKEQSAKAAAVAAVTDISHISADVRALVRRLAADGVLVRILAHNYRLKHAEVRAIIAEGASC